MDALTAVIGSIAALGAMLLASPEEDDVPPGYAVVVMPYCQYEDGNPDGRPCLWVNSDGEGFVNDGHNYTDSNYSYHYGG